MIFEVGKTYQHSTGDRMTIIGRLKTHIYGDCLIGERDTGELVPVGETEANTVNWHEVDKYTVNNVFDKIRAEIEALTDGTKPELIWNVDVLEIIDKCKAESRKEE